MTLEDALNEMPVIAIIRGVKPDEAVAVGEALYAAGIRIVEVPMNSPEPLKSIAALAEAFQGRMVVGAGTVLNTDQARNAAQVGARIAVSPNTDPEVIRTAINMGLTPFPGFATPGEAFSAVRAGATSLKLFPAGSFGPAHLKAIKDVLPAEVRIYPVGGVAPGDFLAWREAGAAGFGIGGDIYKAGRSLAEVGERARAAVTAWRALSSPPIAKVA